MHIFVSKAFTICGALISNFNSLFDAYMYLFECLRMSSSWDRNGNLTARRLYINAISRHLQPFCTGASKYLNEFE